MWVVQDAKTLIDEAKSKDEDVVIAIKNNIIRRLETGKHWFDDKVYCM